MFRWISTNSKFEEVIFCTGALQGKWWRSAGTDFSFRKKLKNQIIFCKYFKQFLFFRFLNKAITSIDKSWFFDIQRIQRIMDTFYYLFQDEEKMSKGVFKLGVWHAACLIDGYQCTKISFLQQVWSWEGIQFNDSCLPRRLTKKPSLFESRLNED